MSDTPTVWVTVETDEIVEETSVSGARDGDDVGGGWGTRSVTEAVKKVTSRKRVPLDAKLLKEQMMGLLEVVSDLFEQASQQPTMKLEELELSVEIDGEGQVNLVGNGAKLGNSGGITMKFTTK
jgi:hypothetical protein